MLGEEALRGRAWAIVEPLFLKRQNEALGVRCGPLAFGPAWPVDVPCVPAPVFFALKEVWK